MASATGQYTNINTANVLVGTATLYVAPNPGGTAAEPMVAQNLTLGDAWTGNWVAVGATESGVTFSMDAKDTNIMIEEEPFPVDVMQESLTASFDVTLAEDTIQNMLLAYGAGSIASTAATGGRADASCGTTAGSATVTDTAITTADVGKQVSGTGVPAGLTIVSVDAGVSFVMSDEATATGTVSLNIGGTGSVSTLTLAIAKNKYSFGMEGVNSFGHPRRIYVPLGVVAGTKVDTAYQRAKAARTYKTTLTALSFPTIYEFTS